MRAFDMALTALALRTSAAQSTRPQRRRAAAVGEPDAAMLNRNALSRQRAALIASLWPEARPCIVPALYLQLAAPAAFGAVFRVSWQPSRSARDACQMPLTDSGRQIARAA